jgi:hypothetical protein
VAPSGVLVVEAAVGETFMGDTDETLPGSSKCRVMRVVSDTVSVVVRVGAR